MNKLNFAIESSFAKNFLFFLAKNSLNITLESIPL